jgi:nitroimidazol reductase NimA-like FMN-containing flavoprotein (pyridoxamine 5'-phosphate oxidase superfamily)
MEEQAITILDSYRIMAISTVRPDGWPQTTIVGYANEGLDIYFLISRESQKLANIEHDNRVSIAVGEEPSDLRAAEAVFAGAYASEVADPGQRAEAWRLLVRRHPNLAGFELPERSEAALMRAECKFVSVLDYTKGLGHTETLTIGGGTATTEPKRTVDWGLSAASPNIKKPVGAGE